MLPSNRRLILWLVGQLQRRSLSQGISNLKQKHASFADEFISLRDQLDSPEDGPTSSSFSGNVSSWELQAKRHREADRNFSNLITRIRAPPGFGSFLCLPSEDELVAAANPVLLSSSI